MGNTIAGSNPALSANANGNDERGTVNDESASGRRIHRSSFFLLPSSFP
ncbi:MAG: hypothetical protein HY679_06485 [Chloroflexi bacterium]|nr:hypothetical protein [Chloroflexota bacterium]